MFETISGTEGTREDVLKEVEHLFLLGVLERSNNSEYGDPSFAQPKPKTDRVRFLSDFRNINKQLKRKPYPMPNNTDFLKLEGFKHTISLDLNMGHYHF